MTQYQLYCQLQAKLQALDATLVQANGLAEEARDLFTQIDPNQLGGALASPLPGPIQPPVQISSGTTTTAPVPVPVTNPKQRVKANTPVLVGPLKDAVEDALAYKAAQAEEAAKPKRIAPYEVLLTSVKYRDLGNDYFADVYDKKYNETAMVPIDKETFDEFNRDSDGLLIDLDATTLEKTEWFPGKKEETLQSMTQSADPDVALMAQAAADGFKELGIDPNDVVFADDPNVEEEE